MREIDVNQAQQIADLIAEEDLPVKSLWDFGAIIRGRGYQGRIQAKGPPIETVVYTWRSLSSNGFKNA